MLGIEEEIESVHSNGKAYTECVDAHEQRQKVNVRNACVNSAGEFYYLAD